MLSITILIVHAQKLVRQAWMLLLDNDARFKVIAECDSVEVAMVVAKKANPEIILLDSNLPDIGGVSPLYLIQFVSQASRLIAVSPQTSPDNARKLIQLGAQGYVTNKSTRQEFMEAIITVHAGDKFLCAGVRESIVTNFTDDKVEKLNKLSPRELEIVEHISRGNSSKEIAAILSISVKTVEVHRYNIMKKLKVKNAAALINYLHRSR